MSTIPMRVVTSPFERTAPLVPPASPSIPPYADDLDSELTRALRRSDDRRTQGFNPAYLFIALFVLAVLSAGAWYLVRAGSFSP